MSVGQVVERIYISGIFTFISPVIIGSGLTNETDQDLLVNGDGIPFIPGTTIAGVLRHSLLNADIEKKEEDAIQKLFGSRGEGNSEEYSSQISRLYVYDANLLDEQTFSISERAGIRIQEHTKVVIDGSKYDYQVLEPECKVQFRFEVVIRKGDNENVIKGLLYQMLNILINGSVRFGAKSNRGFGYGKLEQQSLKILQLPFSNGDRKLAYEQWRNFKWDSYSPNTTIEEWQPYSNRLKLNQWFTFEVPLELQSPILIRSYGDDVHSPDYLQLMSNKKAIIPGTTWNGVIRHHMQRILKELNLDNEQMEVINNKLFGFVNQKEKKSQASRIRFYETIIEEGSSFRQTRVKIDRFTGGAATSALFDAAPYFKGKLKLKIEINKPAKYEIGLLLLVLNDLQEGFVAVGGETAIGRGLLSGNQIFSVHGGNKEELVEKLTSEYYNALADELFSLKEHSC